MANQSINQSLKPFQIEDLSMQQQVDSYKYALREWDDQQQRHRAALQAR
jgi:hypothetical protein